MLRKISVFLLGLSLVACGSPYVNIPAQESDLATHNPNGASVRKVVTHAVRAVLEDQDFSEPVAIRLPEGATTVTHADIARRLGDQVVSGLDESAVATATIEIRQVRIRGLEAEVDLVAPSSSGLPQFLTVYLAWKPLDWYAKRVRVWRGFVESMADGADSEAPGQPKP